MIVLKEPLWGELLLKKLYYWMFANETLVWLIPFLADVFVFVYPVYLVILFICGIIKKKFYYQSSALFAFFATLISVCINIFIQFFIDKARPSVFLELSDLKAQTVLHKFLPSSSFPSDHAAVSMAFASAVFFRGVKNKDKNFIILGIIFYVFSLTMSFARVTSGVHWPTDVIAGSIIGIVVALILFNKNIFIRRENKVNKNLINIFNRIFGIRNYH
ncbi:MAG: phosphatase PAP2 family protein [Candidatus Absconditicoccaceae bacterium]